MLWNMYLLSKIPIIRFWWRVHFVLVAFENCLLPFLLIICCFLCFGHCKVSFPQNILFYHLILGSSGPSSCLTCFGVDLPHLLCGTHISHTHLEIPFNLGKTIISIAWMLVLAFSYSTNDSHSNVNMGQYIILNTASFLACDTSYCLWRLSSCGKAWLDSLLLHLLFVLVLFDGLVITRKCLNHDTCCNFRQVSSMLTCFS